MFLAWFGCKIWEKKTNFLSKNAKKFQTDFPFPPLWNQFPTNFLRETPFLIQIQIELQIQIQI